MFVLELELFTQLYSEATQVFFNHGFSFYLLLSTVVSTP